MSVFIDSNGKYYQAANARSDGDAKIEHPTSLMCEYLTEVPVTIPEFGVGVKEGEVEKLNALVEKTKIEEIVDTENL